MAAGTTVAPGYEVVAHLRRGRRLDVYDVWSERRQCRCIVKTLRPDRSADVPARAQLVREGELLAALTHPHLVRVYETVDAEDPRRPALVLETLSGVTVEHLMRRRRRVGPADVAMLGMQLSSGLGYLHDAGWLHLDVKPANVVASAGRAVLIDLSLAVPVGTRGGGGTFDYLSPEQARGDTLTEAADVWGLGATLHAVMAGRPPYDEVGYDSGSDTTDHRHHPQLDRPPWRLPAGRYPLALRRLVTSCLDLDPDRRPRLADVAAGLAPLAGVDRPSRA
jgi:eukaryotic-like serine/threonine-protein kinase